MWWTSSEINEEHNLNYVLSTELKEYFNTYAALYLFHYKCNVLFTRPNYVLYMQRPRIGDIDLKKA